MPLRTKKGRDVTGIRKEGDFMRGPSYRQDTRGGRGGIIGAPIIGAPIIGAPMHPTAPMAGGCPLCSAVHKGACPHACLIVWYVRYGMGSSRRPGKG